MVQKMAISSPIPVFKGYDFQKVEKPGYSEP